MQTKDNLEAWRVFVSVARTGSIKETAIEQNLDMSAASRLLSSLETDLGFPFFDRHSRPMALTERGQSLVHHAEQLLAYFSQVNEIARSLSGNAVRYKLCYPLNVGRSNLIEQLNDYKKIDPLLEFDLMSECDHEDVLSGRVDIALLPYRPPSKGLVMWSVGKGLNFPLATPANLKRLGTPEKPEDLTNHNLILRTGRNYPPSYFLSRGNEKAPLITKHVVFTGDALSCKAALMSDAGIAMDLSFDLCRQEILRGDLVPVLNGWHRLPWEMTFVMTARLQDNERLMQFCRWIVERETIDNVARWKPMFLKFGGETDIH